MRKQTKLVAVLSAAALLAIGASMTSFAAGWEEQDGEWVYLDKYGDRVYNEWKKSGANYYYLNDEGVMATDVVVEHEDGNKYYVDATGKKVVNTWVALENDDDITVGDNEVSTLWMYFGSTGKATKASEGVKVTSVNYAGGKAKFMFDTEGYMLSGWQRDNDDNLYYLGDENEGWAANGWQYLEPEAGGPDAYEDNVWYYFKSGKAHKAKAGTDYVTKYIDGKYYTFDENGIMQDDWYEAATPPVAASGSWAYASEDGSLALGWVKADDYEDDDEAWFYLVNVREDDGIARSIPFNFGGEKEAAKVIKGKTYLFDEDGEMVTGITELTEATADIEGAKVLEAGIYYFNEEETSVEGQMMTGRVTVEEDGEYFYYHFDKNGKAYTNTIKDGVLYGADGVRVQAEDGNTYELVKLDADIVVDGKDKTVAANTVVAVNSSGRVKTSGSIKIDGVKYDINSDTYAAAKAE